MTAVEWLAVVSAVAATGGFAWGLYCGIRYGWNECLRKVDAGQDVDYR